MPKKETLHPSLSSPVDSHKHADKRVNILIQKLRIT
jgi:hypothetical protein